MHFARIVSAQPELLSARLVSVETDLSRGLHAFTLVGLPDKAVEEARDRVSAAIKNSGFDSPKSTNRKIVISLAPADLRKEGPAFDLPIALSYLSAAGDISFSPEGRLFLGELSLDGSLRRVRGALSAARCAREAGIKEIFVPEESAAEAALVGGVTVFGARTLREVIDHINENEAGERKNAPQGEIAAQEARFRLTPHKRITYTAKAPSAFTDFGDVRGQETAKRGLEIAAAGRHNIVLYGPPGTGKTMLARCFTGILPPLSFEEALEATAIHSIAGLLSEPLLTHPPFRAPHHTTSYAALVGGGAVPRPGEVTLAHRGVLFLDEFAELERRALDALREPLEEGAVTVSRARGKVTFPADFILVAAMNPTRGHGNAETPQESRDRERLRRKISGPIADRVDMWIEVAHVEHKKLGAKREKGGSESEAVRERVIGARERQHLRYKSSTQTNGSMSVRDIEERAMISAPALRTLEESAKMLDLSPRSYHRLIKLARTIADLEGRDEIEEPHILEALQYRPKDLFV